MHHRQVSAASWTMSNVAGTDERRWIKKRLYKTFTQKKGRKTNADEESLKQCNPERVANEKGKRESKEREKRGSDTNR